MAVPHYRQDEDKILTVVSSEKFAHSILYILSLFGLFSELY